MGYYSQVSLATREKDYIALLREARKAESTPGSIVDFLTERYSDICITDYPEEADPVVVLEWYDVKWYSDFESVRFVEEWMNRVCSEEVEARFAFVRIGEDYTDIETSCSPDYNLDGIFEIRRSIERYYDREEYHPVVPDIEEEDETELPESSFDRLANALF